MRFVVWSSYGIRNISKNVAFHSLINTSKSYNQFLFQYKYSFTCSNPDHLIISHIEDASFLGSFPTAVQLHVCPSPEVESVG